MAQVYEQHVHAVREGAQYDGPGEAAQVPGSGAGEGLDCTTPMARFGSSHVCMYLSTTLFADVD